MDGNNSLKRVAGTRVADSRILEDSDYFLSEDFVNCYADEVKAQFSENSTTEGGDPTDGVRGDHACAGRWKAAMAQHIRHMWALFHETGIFAAACRHGFVLWLVDMIRSGEL